MTRAVFILQVILYGQLLAQEQSGEISGQVIDAATQMPLPGVNIVVVEKPTIGAATDMKGNFIIRNLSVGEYSLRASMVGYTPVVITNVVVSTGRGVLVKIKLAETLVELEEVEISADYFSKAGAISAVSTQELDAREIRRSPGAAQDMHRVMQVLPSVANSNDQTNEMIVRGGAPNENLTVMDNIEIPTTNHYPNQFNSGGPISMVNVDLIEDIQFSSGGFPAQFGNKLSSAMNVTIREGDRRRTFASQTSVHFAGFGTVMEGGFAGEKGAWLFSARKSFLETLDNIIGISALGVTAVPKYWDTQFKIVYDLSPTQKLSLSGIYGDDKILFRGSETKESSAKAGVTDSSSLVNVDFFSYQYAAGVSLKSLWGSKGFSILTLSQIGNRYIINVNTDYSKRVFDALGKLRDTQLLTTRKTFDNDSRETFAGLKLDAYYQLFPNHEISLGGIYETSVKFDNSVNWYPDTTRFDLNGDGTFETGPITFPRGVIRNMLGFGDAHRIGAYLSDRWKLSSLLSMTVGLRYDYLSYSGQGNFGPRISLSYEIFPAVTRLSAAYGEYYQTLSYPFYSDNRNIGYNRNLENSHARHFVLGLEHILSDGLKLSVESYYKQYSNLTISEQFVHSADRTFRSDKNLTIGERRSFGIEFFLQQKQVRDYYGTLSYSYGRTQDRDPRLPPLTEWYTSEYDFPHILTLVIGRFFKGIRSALDESPWFVKYPTIVFPFSDDMEVSVRFRYQSGKPYTPRIYSTSEQHREGGIAWSRGWWVEGNDVNSIRYPDYHRLDIQWISRYHFSGYNIGVLFLLENAYNRANVAQFRYRSDGTIETVYQFSFFPVVGVGIEF